MKATLTFNLPEEREEFIDALNGAAYKVALDDIHTQLFRPLHKHGYKSDKLRKLTETHQGAVEAIEILAEMYNTIVRDLKEY